MQSTPPTTPPRRIPTCPECTFRLIRHCDRCGFFRCGRCGCCRCFYPQAVPRYIIAVLPNSAQGIYEAERHEEQTCGLPPFGDLQTPSKTPAKNAAERIR